MCVIARHNGVIGTGNLLYDVHQICFSEATNLGEMCIYILQVPSLTQANLVNITFDHVIQL